MPILRGGRQSSQTGENSAQQDLLQQILDRLDAQQQMIEQLRNEIRETRDQFEQDKEARNKEREEMIGGEHVGTEESAQPTMGQEDLHSWFIKFRKHQPPMFKGHFDAQQAEDWMVRLEKIFRVMQCSSKVKAEMAIYKLEGDADRWWKNVELVLQARNTPITWELFQEKFNEMYFPQSVRDDKETEFLNLKQADNETFDEYLAKFIRLCRYCKCLRFIGDEEWSVVRLVWGLKPILRERLPSKQFTSFNLAVNVCRLTESCMMSLNHSRSMSKQESSVYVIPSRKRRNQQPWLMEDNIQYNHSDNCGFQGDSESKSCAQCNKFHGGRPCMHGQNVCFNCGKPGHFARDCNERPIDNKPRNQGSVCYDS